MDKSPPKWAVQFIKRTCSEPFQDELLGDLEELFHREIDTKGYTSAKKRFVFSALLSPRWYRLPSINQYSIAMQRNHFRMAFRHVFKYRVTSFIQIIGLGLGLAVTFFVGLYLKNEFAYDQMHLNKRSLYRVLRYNPSSGERSLPTSSLDGKTIGDEFPSVKVCRFGKDPVKIGQENPILIKEFYWTDSTFFDLFTFQFIAGNPKSCLANINSIVITESLSKKLFGDQSSLNQSIKVKVYDGDQEMWMKVTAVVKDPDPKSHIQFKALGSMPNAEKLYAHLVGHWYFSWLRTYILLPPNSNIHQIESQVPGLIDKSFGGNPPNNFGWAFQPFEDIYLHSQNITRNNLKGSIFNIYMFTAIALLVLLLSVINYVNLATARTINRSKEVGIRKVLGSKSHSIITQFIVEAIVFLLLSGILALGMLLPSLYLLNDWFELNLSIWQWSLFDWFYLLLLLVSVGFIGGILPALSMVKIPMLDSIQSSLISSTQDWPSTRKIFIGVQFLISIILVSATIVIYKQYQYIRTKDLGFNPEQLLHITVEDREVQKKLTSLKDQISKIPGVVGICATGEDLPSQLNNTWNFNWPGSDLETPYSIDIVGVDEDYFPVIGVDLIAGQNFTHLTSDSARVIILNKKAVEKMGQYTIGQEVLLDGSPWTLIGVANNHHHASLHQETVPLAYANFPPGFRVSPDNLMIRLASKDISNLLPKLEQTWSAFSNDPIQFNFVDEAFASAYHQEKRFAKLMSAFTLLALLISMIGLFGLIHFIVKLKLREISIRKVLGASPIQLISLLSKDFLLVYVLSVVIAIPIALKLAQNWLSNYPYRIQVGWDIFLLAGFICLIISCLVILFHWRKTLKIDPAKILSSD